MSKVLIPEVAILTRISVSSWTCLYQQRSANFQPQGLKPMPEPISQRSGWVAGSLTKTTRPYTKNTPDNGQNQHLKPYLMVNNYENGVELPCWEGRSSNHLAEFIRVHTEICNFCLPGIYIYDRWNIRHECIDVFPNSKTWDLPLLCLFNKILRKIVYRATMSGAPSIKDGPTWVKTPTTVSIGCPWIFTLWWSGVATLMTSYQLLVEKMLTAICGAHELTTK